MSVRFMSTDSMIDREADSVLASRFSMSMDDGTANVSHEDPPNLNDDKKVDFELEAALSKEEENEDTTPLTEMERIELAYAKEKADKKLQAKMEKEKLNTKTLSPKTASNQEDQLRLDVLEAEAKVDEAMQKLKAASSASDEAWHNAKEWEKHATLPPAPNRPEEKRQLYARMWEIQLESVKNSHTGRAIAQDELAIAQRELNTAMKRLDEFRSRQNVNTQSFFERANKSIAWQTHLASIKMETISFAMCRMCASH